MAATHSRHRRLVVPWGTEFVEADVLGVTGSPPLVQVHLAIADDTAAADPEGPVEFVLHPSDLPPDAVRHLTQSGPVRNAG